jgi:RNA polymerase sigma-70 factor (ECF subfamily)
MSQKEALVPAIEGVAEAHAMTQPVAPAPHPQEVFEQHAVFVWRTVRRFGVAEADLQDAAQEVFLVVLRRLVDFDTRAALRPWLYGICMRVAAEYRRRATARREIAVDELPEPPVAPGQDAGVRQRELHQRLTSALAGLDPKQSEVFVLFELEELTLAEIAEAVGCPLQTAYSRLQVARRHVQQAFARAEGSTL